MNIFNDKSYLDFKFLMTKIKTKYLIEAMKYKRKIFGEKNKIIDLKRRKHSIL